MGKKNVDERTKLTRNSNNTQQGKGTKEHKKKRSAEVTAVGLLANCQDAEARDKDTREQHKRVTAWNRYIILNLCCKK